MQLRCHLDSTTCCGSLARNPACSAFGNSHLLWSFRLIESIFYPQLPLMHCGYRANILLAMQPDIWQLSSIWPPFCSAPGSLGRFHYAFWCPHAATQMDPPDPDMDNFTPASVPDAPLFFRQHMQKDLQLISRREEGRGVITIKSILGLQGKYFRCKNFKVRQEW